MKKTIKSIILTTLILINFQLNAQVENGVYYSSQNGVKKVKITKATAKSFTVTWIKETDVNTLSFEDTRPTLNYKLSDEKKGVYIAHEVRGTKYGEQLVSMIQVKEGYLIESAIYQGFIVNALILATTKEKVMAQKKSEANYALVGLEYTVNKNTTYPFLLENSQKILFSNSTIEKESEGNGNLISSYTLGDPLYYRLYLEGPLKGLAYRYIGEKVHHYRVDYQVYLDDQLVGEEKDKIENSELINEWYSWRNEIYLSGEREQSSIGMAYSQMILNHASKLIPGKHQLRIEAYINHSQSDKRKSTVPMAVGELELIVPANGASAVLNDGAFKLPKAGMTDAKLKSKILVAVQEHAKDEGWDETYKAVIIESDGWNILRKDYTGTIIARSVIAYCYATWPDGRCSYTRKEFAQSYTGEGYQDRVQYIGRIDTYHTYIPCESMP